MLNTLAANTEKRISDPANNPFRTPSREIEIYSQEPGNVGDPMLPPIAKYIEVWESRSDPLVFMWKNRRRLEWFYKGEGICPID